MKKAIFESYGNTGVLKIIDSEIPAISQHEVLVRVEAAALNPKDILVRKGKFKQFTGKKFPQSIGFDFSGKVENANGSEFPQGSHVYGMVNGWNGRCCAEYINVNKNELFQKPENISFEDAAGIPLAAQTALQGIRDQGKLKSGQHILINGASGGVGTLAIQIAKAIGGNVTTVSSTKNMDFCTSLGADHTLSYQDIKIPDLSERYDVFFDVFGNYSFKKVSHLLTSKGIFVSTIPNAEIIKEQLFNPLRKKKAKLVVVKSNRKDLQWLAEHISQSSIMPVTDKVYPLEQIGDAQAYIETKRAKGKVILTP
ncbi:MAG: NAD(P)-dependent alcohol dehydrogenase [Bacteroidota bacterium]